MKPRSAIILTHNDEIVLIERYRSGCHYFTFPGGKVKTKETPVEAAAREALEELGVEVKIGRMVAEVSYLGTPQYYYLAEITGGSFGHGLGLELIRPADSEKGSCKPVWMQISQLSNRPVLPKIMAEFIIKSYREGWPEEPLIVADLTPDNF